MVRTVAATRSRRRKGVRLEARLAGRGRHRMHAPIGAITPLMPDRFADPSSAASVTKPFFTQFGLSSPIGQPRLTRIPAGSRPPLGHLRRFSRWRQLPSAPGAVVGCSPRTQVPVRMEASTIAPRPGAGPRSDGHRDGDGECAGPAVTPGPVYELRHASRSSPVASRCASIAATASSGAPAAMASRIRRCAAIVAC